MGLQTEQAPGTESRLSLSLQQRSRKKTEDYFGKSISTVKARKEADFWEAPSMYVIHRQQETNLRETKARSNFQSRKGDSALSPQAEDAAEEGVHTVSQVISMTDNLGTPGAQKWV